MQYFAFIQRDFVFQVARVQHEHHAVVTLTITRAQFIIINYNYIVTLFYRQMGNRNLIIQVRNGMAV